MSQGFAPFYDVNRTYEDNYLQGPFGAFAEVMKGDSAAGASAQSAQTTQSQSSDQAEEFLGLVGRLRLGGLCRLRGGAGSGIALHHFGERTERPLQIVVFIRAIDVVKRRETLAHTAPRNCSRVMFWICDANTRNVMSTVTRHTSRLHAPSHLGNLLG